MVEEWVHELGMGLGYSHMDRFPHAGCSLAAECPVRGCKKQRAEFDIRTLGSEINFFQNQSALWIPLDRSWSIFRVFRLVHDVKKMMSWWMEMAQVMNIITGNFVSAAMERSQSVKAGPGFFVQLWRTNRAVLGSFLELQMTCKFTSVPIICEISYMMLYLFICLEHMLAWMPRTWTMSFRPGGFLKASISMTMARLGVSNGSVDRLQGHRDFVLNSIDSMI